MKDLAFLLLVYYHLVSARFLLWTLPFSKVKARLGRSGVEGCQTASGADLRLARRISAAIDLMGCLTPFRATCIVQALAARRLLATRGVPSTLYFGMHKFETGFGAHAWLRVGSFIVTGGETRDENTVVGVYS